MGSVGERFDNAMAESFFATLECEWLDRTHFHDPGQAGGRLITRRAEPSSSSSRDGITRIVVTGASVSNPPSPSRGATRKLHETQALLCPLNRGNSSDRRALRRVPAPAKGYSRCRRRTWRRCCAGVAEGGGGRRQLPVGGARAGRGVRIRQAERAREALPRRGRRAAAAARASQRGGAGDPLARRARSSARRRVCAARTGRRQGAASGAPGRSGPALSPDTPAPGCARAGARRGPAGVLDTWSP